MKLSGGAQAKNIYWAVAGVVAFQNAHGEGIFLAKTNISFTAGSSLNGAALAQTAVTMISTTINHFDSDAGNGGGTQTGGGYGDPHLKTWLGEMYDFHGACDLVLIKSRGFHNQVGLEIQIRTEIRHDWSFIAHTAIKIGNDILEVGGHGEFALNGIAGEKLTANADLQSLNGFVVKYFNDGTRRHTFKVDIGHQQKIVIKVYNEFLSVTVRDAEEEYFGDSVGLMGNYHTGKLVGRDGTLHTNTDEFGFDWQVNGDDVMLFSEMQAPQFPQQCRMPSAEATQRRKRRLSESMVSYDEAEAAYASWEKEDRESCIFDVLSTGDLSMSQGGAF
jgi:hypothetical protein